MSTAAKLSRLWEKSPVLPFDDHSKIVLMSDCHRGMGNWGDNFLKNQNKYFAALRYYYEQGYIYIELGDGDELWECRDLTQIIDIHSNVFWLMSKFYYEHRFFMLYGNHDRVKQSPRYVGRNCSQYRCTDQQCLAPLFPDIQVLEGLVLQYEPTKDKILLAHGHQGDWLNDTLWKMARFLVRYVWKPVETAGVNDPTSAAKNYRKKNKTERRLVHWAQKSGNMLVAGHTHRPVLPKFGEPLYFNDGSCVHPRCITALELTGGKISLVKWSVKTRQDRSLYVGREVLDGPNDLKKYFVQNVQFSSKDDNTVA